MNEALPTGLKFTILHRVFRQNMDIAVKNIDLTGAQFAILGQLRRLENLHGGEVSQKMLEEATHTTHATMTEILKKLEKKGFLLSRPSEIDRRSKAICTTEQSRALHVYMDECDGKIFNALTAGIPEGEIAVMCSVIDRMVQNARSFPCEMTTENKGGLEL